MFVRWQKRERNSRRFPFGSCGTDTHWAAILAESKRVDGKPRQQHIAYLGGINDSALELPAHRGYFWQEVTQQLDQLSNRVLKDDRTRIEEAIAEKVPRLTRQEYDAWLVNRAALVADFGTKGHSEMPSFEICETPQKAEMMA
jgi:hypothetical protein